jgi:DNA-binding Lrp family transcriptional regulator
MYQQAQKTETIMRIISFLQREGVSSRSALAERLSLYTSTISIRMKELLDKGIIRERGHGRSESRGGRRAAMVELDPAYGNFGGIYLGHGGIHTSLFTPGLQVTYKEFIPVTVENRNRTPDLLRKAIQKLAGEQSHGRIPGIGFAVSSVVRAGGVVEASSHFPLAIDELPELLAKEFPETAFCIDNDANLAALADSALLSQEYENILHLLVYDRLPTIGSGLFLGGKLYRGGSGASGELDEDIWTLKGSLSKKIELLAKLMGRYLDVDAVFISGELEASQSRELEKRLERWGGSFSLSLINEPQWVEKGAALMAMGMHFQGSRDIADWRKR